MKIVSPPVSMRNQEIEHLRLVITTDSKLKALLKQHLKCKIKFIITLIGKCYFKEKIKSKLGHDIVFL